MRDVIHDIVKDGIDFLRSSIHDDLHEFIVKCLSGKKVFSISYH